MLWFSVWCGGTRELEPDSAILPGMARKRGLQLSGLEKWVVPLAVSFGGQDNSIDAMLRDREASRSACISPGSSGCSRASISGARIKAEVIWFCVPDGEIASAAHRRALIRDNDSGFTPSGLLSSDQLMCYGRSGANVASVHPLMSFVPGSRLTGGRIIRHGRRRRSRPHGETHRKDLRGEPFVIRKKIKRRITLGPVRLALLTALLERRSAWPLRRV